MTPERLAEIESWYQPSPYLGEITLSNVRELVAEVRRLRSVIDAARTVIAASQESATCEGVPNDPCTGGCNLGTAWAVLRDAAV